MRLIHRRPDRCDRARDWISRALDGDLSELEQTLLTRHLDVCEHCTAFHADATAFTGALRTAQLELLARPVELPRARRLALRPLQVAAGLAIAAIGAGSVFGTLQSRGSSSATGSATPRVSVEREMAAQRGFQFERRDLALQVTVLATQSKHGGPQAV